MEGDPLMKSRTYKVTPARAVIPAVPILEPQPRPIEELRTDHTIQVTGALSMICTTEGARREAEAMLANCQARFRAGNRRALIELLDANPAFIAVPWVRETLVRLLKAGWPLRRQGRIGGKHEFHPLVVVGLVNHLIAMGDAKNPEQALSLLEEIRVLNYGTAKDLYYRGVREDRFKPILIEFPELARHLPAEVVEPVLSRAEVPGPGKPVQRKRVGIPGFGDIAITLQSP